MVSKVLQFSGDQTSIRKFLDIWRSVFDFLFVNLKHLILCVFVCFQTIKKWRKASWMSWDTLWSMKITVTGEFCRTFLSNIKAGAMSDFWVNLGRHKHSKRCWVITSGTLGQERANELTFKNVLSHQVTWSLQLQLRHSDRLEPSTGRPEKKETWKKKTCNNKIKSEECVYLYSIIPRLIYLLSYREVWGVLKG